MTLTKKKIIRMGREENGDSEGGKEREGVNLLEIEGRGNEREGEGGLTEGENGEGEGMGGREK